MKKRTKKLSVSPVPSSLVNQIETALARVDTVRAECDAATSAGMPLSTRRQLNTELTEAFEAADVLLRSATTAARQRGCVRPAFVAWSQWRRRLSRLDDAFQIHLFTESDDLPVLDLGEICAIDTGMSGPSIGDMQHGQSRPAGAPGRYGLDMAALLGATV